MTNDRCFEWLLERAEEAGENVVFVLEDSDVLDGVDVYKLPVPGTLNRKEHFFAWFMHLTVFHGRIHGPWQEADIRHDAEALRRRCPQAKKGH